MALEFGDLCLMNYGNWHHDPTPLIFVLYSDNLYTHGLNSHYITKPEAEQLRRLMSYVPPQRAQYVYWFLKARFNTVLRSYRKYKTPLIFTVKSWKGKQLRSPKTKEDVLAHYGPNKQYRAMMRADIARREQASLAASRAAMLVHFKNILNRLQRKRKR